MNVKYIMQNTINPIKHCYGFEECYEKSYRNNTYLPLLNMCSYYKLRTPELWFVETHAGTWLFLKVFIWV
jgi:hypothetical protein